jgi:hypothetical protein
MRPATKKAGKLLKRIATLSVNIAAQQMIEEATGTDSR